MVVYTAMADIVVRSESVSLDEPILVEGLPGLGLVGKIAADHLVDQLDFEYYADIIGEGIPPVTTFSEGETEVRSPVRLHANEAEDLVVLQGDVPISVASAPGFTESLTDWTHEQDAMPLFLTGFPAERELDVEPDIYGVATGEGDQILEELDVTPPNENGIISGRPEDYSRKPGPRTWIRSASSWRPHRSSRIRRAPGSSSTPESSPLRTSTSIPSHSSSRPTRSSNSGSNSPSRCARPTSTRVHRQHRSDSSETWQIPENRARTP